MKKVIFGLLMCIVMATDMPAEILADTPALASDVEKIRINRVGDLLPVSENSLNYIDNSESLGSSLYRWRDGHFANTLNVNIIQAQTTTDPYLSSLVSTYNAQQTLQATRALDGTDAQSKILFATQDIFIAGYIHATNGLTVYGNANIYADNQATPTTLILKMGNVSGGSQSTEQTYIPFFLAIKKGEYYKIEVVATRSGGTSTATTTAYWREMRLSL